MTATITLTQEIQDKIKQDMIFGYIDDEGKKVYPKLTDAAEWYKVSYDSLKQKARKWNWRQKRKDHIKNVKQKIAEKKREEEISESEAEEIVVNDYKFNNTANKLRRAITKEIEKISNGEIYLYSLKDGTPVYGTPKNTAYLLMNLGKALESSQKVSKIAAGEPDSIQEVNGESTVKISNPAADVKNLEETLKNGVGSKDLDSAIEEFIGKKADNTVNENTKKSDISVL